MNARKLLLAAGIVSGVAGLLLTEVGAAIYAHGQGLVVFLLTLGGVSVVNSFVCCQMLEELKKDEEEEKRKNEFNYHG